MFTVIGFIECSFVIWRKVPSSFYKYFRKAQYLLRCCQVLPFKFSSFKSYFK